MYIVRTPELTLEHCRYQKRFLQYKLVRQNAGGAHDAFSQSPGRLWGGGGYIRRQFIIIIIIYSLSKHIKNNNAAKSLREQDMPGSFEHLWQPITTAKKESSLHKLTDSVNTYV